MFSSEFFQEFHSTYIRKRVNWITMNSNLNTQSFLKVNFDFVAWINTWRKISKYWNLEKIYLVHFLKFWNLPRFTQEISKFQKSELGKFIPNFPLKHVITSTNLSLHHNSNKTQIHLEHLNSPRFEIRDWVKYEGLMKTLRVSNFHLRIHWRLSTIFKKSKKVYEVMFFNM